MEQAREPHATPVAIGARWLPFGSAPDAKVRLLCLPHAGAGASVFRQWGRALGPQVACCPVQPPGREKRRAEPPFTAVGPLVRELADEIAAVVTEPYALFGHSTGALAAFEVVRELRAHGGPMPVHLFVSGRRGPQLPMDRVDIEALAPSDLADLLRLLGGTPEELLTDVEVLEAIQPLLAADFSVNQDYVHVSDTPLETPVTAFAGVDDADADTGWMASWQEQTTGAFTLHELDDGHFAVFTRREQVHQVIAAALSSSLDART